MYVSYIKYKMHIKWRIDDVVDGGGEEEEVWRAEFIFSVINKCFSYYYIYILNANMALHTLFHYHA